MKPMKKSIIIIITSNQWSQLTRSMIIRKKWINNHKNNEPMIRVNNESMITVNNESMITVNNESMITVNNESMI